MAVDHHNQLLLITGATGHQGGAVVQRAVEHGFHVRALVRNPQKPAAHKLKNEGVEIAQGDFDDRASLDRAHESDSLYISRSLAATFDRQARINAWG